MFTMSIFLATSATSPREESNTLNTSKYQGWTEVATSVLTSGGSAVFISVQSELNTSRNRTEVAGTEVANKIAKFSPNLNTQ